MKMLFQTMDNFLIIHRRSQLFGRTNPRRSVFNTAYIAHAIIFSGIQNSSYFHLLILSPILSEKHCFQMREVVM
jgi:hypothetical protein